MTDLVVGVLGGSGGVGASSFAASLAFAARPSVLIDLDPVGGGIDVLLGIESVGGARWSGLRLDGGHLDPGVLAGGLPRWNEVVAVLAADVEPAPSAAAQVVEAAGQLGPVVLDLPRAPSPLRDTMLSHCELSVLVLAGEVRELAAARAVLRTLPAGVVLGAVVRRGALSPESSAELLGLPLVGALPPSDRSPGAGRAHGPVAAGVLDAMLARVAA
jgi:hypothetical protein